MRRGLALAGLLVFLAAPALTRPACAENDIDCADAETQADLNACAESGFDTADTVMNEEWSAARVAAKELDSGQDAADQGAAQALLAAQRGWIAYRDGECEAEGFAAHRGTLEPMLVAQCKARLTLARTRELRAFVKREEGQ